MGSRKIPVWVYTAKNGYAWQGLEGNAEDRPTAAALDKALAAAGKTAGAWGAVVRRPVASRRWAEWPRSRLCWLLFRFHPEAGRDQRGRSCNYTAVACIPAGDGLPKLDFGKLFAAPAMSEVKSEGLEDLWIDLDGEEDCTLKGSVLKFRGAENAPEPSWEDNWTAPLILKEDALRMLSRWCQGHGVDAGDLKALVREGTSGTREPVVLATWTVYPQVAAARAAEQEWFTAQGVGGATARQALEKWRTALRAVGELNRALGGLEGLAALLDKWNAALDRADGVAQAAEQSARQMAAAAASAEAAAAEIARGLQRFRMGTDEERGKGDNRWKLDDLARGIDEARRRHGPGTRWNTLERDLDELRRRVTMLEGHLDTVRAFQRAAAAGTGASLEHEARSAIMQSRELSRWGNGLFAQDALFEMERLYRIGNAQGTAAGTADPNFRKWIEAGMAAGNSSPVSFGGGAAEADGGGHHRHHRHGRHAWKHWWGRWWWAVAAAAVTVLLVLPWWLMRQGELERWGNIRDKACKQAEACNYSQALATLDKIPNEKWRQTFLALHRDTYAADFQKPWSKLVLIERDLQAAISNEKAAREVLEGVEAEKKGTFEGKKSKARVEWDAYERARRDAENQQKALGFGRGGIPLAPPMAPNSPREQVWNDLPRLYARTADLWLRAATHLNEACQIIDRIENPTMQERRLSLLAVDPGTAVATAREKAVAAESKLKAHEWETEALNIGRKYAWNQWAEYANYRKQADDFMESIVYDEDGWPYRKTEVGTQPLSLDAGALRKLAEDYRKACNNWTKALEARQNACRTIREVLDENRRKLNKACKQEQAEKKGLVDLLRDSRYEAAQKSPFTVEVWNEFVDLYEKAERLKKEIPAINAGLPVPAPTVLETNTLDNLCGKVNEVSDLWRQARQKLTEAYQIVSREKAENEQDNRNTTAATDKMPEQEAEPEPEPEPESESEQEPESESELEPNPEAKPNQNNGAVAMDATPPPGGEQDAPNTDPNSDEKPGAVKRWWRNRVVSLFRSEEEKPASQDPPRIPVGHGTGKTTRVSPVLMDD